MNIVIKNVIKILNILIYSKNYSVLIYKHVIKSRKLII